MKTAVASIIAVTCLSPLASAAETWTGFNAGVELGYGRSESAISDVNYNWYGGTYSYWTNGALLGLSGGYDRQFGSLVIGGILDWNWTTFDETKGYSNAPVVQIQVSNSIDWVASLRARAGLAVDNTLIFVTAGPAIGAATNEWKAVNGTNPNNAWKSDDQLVGIMVSIGLEHMISDRLSIRGELESVTFNETSAQDTRPQPDTWQVQNSFQAVKIGAHYRF